MRAAAPLLATVATSVAAATLLVACGGSSSPSDAAAHERAQEQQAETKFADFAKCLREHGVSAEAISQPGGGHGFKIHPGSAHGPAAFEAAQNACARYRPEPKKVNLSPQQKVEFEERVQKFAKCMREHGIKVEASTQGGGVQIGIHPGSGGPNPESPGFQAAQSACQKLLPKPPGAQGRGGPAGVPFTAKGGAGGVSATGR
jgi:hypothetical protein